MSKKIVKNIDEKEIYGYTKNTLSGARVKIKLSRDNVVGENIVVFILNDSTFTR